MVLGRESGAQWLDRRAGSFGRAAAFSFYPGKNLGPFGDEFVVAVAANDIGAEKALGQAAVALAVGTG